MSLWTVLLTGLFAGGASCAAVQGGLLAGVVARRRQPAPVRVGAATADGAKRAKPTPPPAPTPIEDALPVGMFLAGKLVSHVVLGASLGLLGNAVLNRPGFCGDSVPWKWRMEAWELTRHRSGTRLS